MRIKVQTGNKVQSDCTVILTKVNTGRTSNSRFVQRMLRLKHWIDSQDRSLQCGSTVCRTPLRYGLGWNLLNLSAPQRLVEASPARGLLQAASSPSNSGLVPLTFRSPNSFRQPFVQRPRDFCHLAMSVAAVDYRIR